MKLLQTTLLVTTLLLACFQAQAVSVSPSDCDFRVDDGDGLNCLVARIQPNLNNPGERKVTNPGNGSIINAFSNFPVLPDGYDWINGLEELYKAESKDGQSAPDKELGSLAGSYTTLFDWDKEEDFASAKVTYDGGSFVDCTLECYLLVKGGNHDPVAYLFNLALNPFGWDGKMDLLLSDFWTGRGSISYLALYGNASPNPVPLPAGVWLFGTALIGLAGFGKRRKAA